MVPVLQSLLFLPVSLSGGRLARVVHASNNVRIHSPPTEHIDDKPCRRPVCHLPHRVPIGGVSCSTTGITYRLF